MTDNAWNIRSVPVDFIIDTTRAQEALNGPLRDAVKVAIDTETVIVRDADGNIVKRDLDVDGPGMWRVMSIAAKFETPTGPRYQAWVLDMLHVDSSALADALEGIVPWGWHANFDRGVLRRGGLNVRYWHDAMLYDAVLKQGAVFASNERAWYTSLDDATIKWLGSKGIEGKQDVRLNYDAHTPLTDAEIQYAADDAISTLFVGEVVEAEAKVHGLLEACQRTCLAQPFINSMKLNGLPFDTTTYQRVIDHATSKANAAAERIAVLTTGRDLLRMLVRWGVGAGHIKDDLGHLEGDDTAAQEFVVSVGLPLLHDAGTFLQFIGDVREQAAGVAPKIAKILGVGDAVEDLFSDNPRYPLPFDLTDEAAIRRWIKKVEPQFVAEYLAATGSTSQGLTKANDMLDVYEQLRTKTSGVSEDVARIAAHLHAYTRYTAILSQYGQVAGAATLRPDWLLSSTDQVKLHLNTVAQENVLAYFKATTGTGRLLTKSDSVDGTVLKLIGGPLAEALLEYREHDKVVTTYGDELVKHVHPETGRIHANYTQELTGTARLSSSEPNAQNLSPQAKPHIGVTRLKDDGTLETRDPQGRQRVLIAADLSQAELRVLAHMAQDENMLAAFRSGEDLHTRTASRMFSLDLLALKANGDKAISDLVTFIPGLNAYAAANGAQLAKELFAQLRSKAKAVSFGYAYGLRGASLAQQLTVAGVPTTKAEADELLAQFDVAYPQVAAWMASRVRFIQDLGAAIKERREPSKIDFESSWRLHKLYFRVNSARKTLANKLGHKPTAREIAEHMVPDEALRARLTTGVPENDHGPDWDAAWEAMRQQHTQQVAWALGHYGSVILSEDGTPWSFESRNLANRRRVFQIGTSSWTDSMVALVARSRRSFARDVTDAWVAQHHETQMRAYEERIAAGGRGTAPKPLALRKIDPRTKREVSLTADELKKVLSTKELRISFVEFVLKAYDSMPAPQEAREYLFRHAMADCIRAAGNQYRNHPIQSAVADAMLVAYHRIDRDLTQGFPTAGAIQSVHDSIVIECDLADALAVREMIVRHMEAALAELCPSVPCIADGDIQLSLDSKSTITDEQVKRLIEKYTLAA